MWSLRVPAVSNNVEQRANNSHYQCHRCLVVFGPYCNFIPSNFLSYFVHQLFATQDAIDSKSNQTRIILIDQVGELLKSSDDKILLRGLFCWSNSFNGLINHFPLVLLHVGYAETYVLEETFLVSRNDHTIMRVSLSFCILTKWLLNSLSFLHHVTQYNGVPSV